MAYRTSKKAEFPRKTFGDFLTYQFHNLKRARTKGTFVRFGTGEERFGVITRVVPNGVYVQEFREPSYKEGIGLRKVGKPFFANQKRFWEHLGEKGAVGIETFEGYPVFD